MHNRLYDYFMNTNLLHKNKFIFQINSLTEYAILQFARDIALSFNNGKFTLGFFIDILKTLGSVDHQTLLKKLKHY